MASIQTCKDISLSLKEGRSEWDRQWTELRDLVYPRGKANEDDKSNNDPSRGHCERANKGVQALAAAHSAYITPAGEMWFKFESSDIKKDDEADEWLNDTTEITHKQLASSNFYSESHECWLDRASLGTAAMFCSYSDENKKLVFDHIQCGSFSVAENELRKTDVIVRHYEQSAYKIVNRFGENGLRCEKVRAAYNDAKKRYSKSFRVAHIVRPSEGHNQQRVILDSRSKRFESIYFLEDEDFILEESGFDEFPFFVTRFLKWGSGPYGLPPAFHIKKTIKRCKSLETLLDVLGEIKAFPRILELANQVGEVDFRAGGRTIVSPEAAQMGLPKEWGTSGDYNIGMDLLKRCEEIIDEAFYIPALQIISSVDRQMTATEVIARENEKLLTISPSFTLLTDEMEIIFNRIFALLFRAGHYPKPPKSLITENENGAFVTPPKIQLTGKMAIAFQRLQTDGLIRGMSQIGELSQVYPGMTDVVSPREAGKIILRTLNVNEDVIRSDAELKEMDEERAAQAQAEQDMAMLQAGASAARDGAEAASKMGGMA